MIEIPEAIVLSRQLNEAFDGLRIVDVVAAQSPHKFAWYTGDPAEYDSKLSGKIFGEAYPMAGRVEVTVEDYRLDMGEGAVLRYLAPGQQPPKKHQLLLTFEDGSQLVGTVAMYGLYACFREGENDGNEYFVASRDAVSPLSEQFDQAFFESLLTDKTLKLSVKAFLATEQRIPGLGNGVLQDILFNAGVNPRRKMNTLDEAGLLRLFASVKSTLAEMAADNGRDTERDLYGNPGGYLTKMSRLALERGCPTCSGRVTRQAYMGGNVYYCAKCQPL